VNDEQRRKNKIRTLENRSCEETHRALNKGVSARVFVDRFGRSWFVLTPFLACGGF